MGETARAKTKKEPPGAPELKAVRGQSIAPDLDRLIHERVRLAIVSALAVNRSMSFNELKSALDVTDGNLSVHARKLEDAGYLTCTKTFEDRVPHTRYSLTDKGRLALRHYLDHMEALIRTVRG